MRSSSHHPSPSKRVGEMTLYDGIYGKAFGGTDSDLKFTPYQASYPAKVYEVDQRVVRTMRTAIKNTVMVSSAKSERDFLDYFKQDNICVQCNPKCGGCRYGQ